MKKMDNVALTIDKQKECEPKQTCDQKCADEYKPLCDLKGNTYRNRCLYENVACLKQQKGEMAPEIAHPGPCPSTTMEECTAEACPTDVDPVCGDDGQTYDNQCHFDQANCQHFNRTGKLLEVKYEGACGGIRNEARTDSRTTSLPPRVIETSSRLPDIDLTTSINVQLPSEATIFECNNNCSKEREPVCDSKGKEHLNACEFEFYRCEIMKKTKETISVIVR